MVNSLWCQFLWRRWIAVICENNNGASGERFMWKRCGSFQCLWNHSSVTSRLCPREKRTACVTEWNSIGQTKQTDVQPFLCHWCVSVNSEWFYLWNSGVSRAYSCEYIYMYIFVRMYWFGYRFGCMFVWLVRLWVCWVPLLVRWTHGFFCWGAPLCYIWLSKSL